MSLLSLPCLRRLFTPTLLLFIFSIPFIFRIPQDHDSHGLHLKFENPQEQPSSAQVLYREDNFKDLHEQQARKDILKDAMPLKASPHFRHLHKRTVTSEVWSQYICKGDKLLDLMAMNIEDATKALGFASESTFTSYNDLETNGWRMYDKSTNFNFANLHIDKVFQDLGFDRTSGGPLDLEVKNRVVSWSQDEKYVVDGTEHDPSDAQYINTFNPTQGLIGAWSNYGPAYQLKDEPNAIQPNLRQWSDVAFLEWKHQVGKSGGSKNGKLPAPKMILRINMMNAETLNLIDQILRNLPETERPKGPTAWGVPTPPWPGKTFSMDSESGKALLGSPNGRGVAWFLLQHKQAFGIKTLSSAVVFKEAGAVYCVFIIADAN